jgi:uncharacterized membrane protein YvbJ
VDPYRRGSCPSCGQLLDDDGACGACRRRDDFAALRMEGREDPLTGRRAIRDRRAQGVAMMVVAVIWLVAGLAFGRFFFYPPILFVIGLVRLASARRAESP